MNYQEWAQRHPQAAAELQQVITCDVPDVERAGRSEAWAQQQVRMALGRAGGIGWRNNVGATPARCPDCGVQQQPVRYGLANDSARLNERIKSSDVIGIVPRLILPQDVGTTIGQFAAFEVKRPGWQYKGDKREAAQAAFHALVIRFGGRAGFTTGSVTT